MIYNYIKISSYSGEARYIIKVETGGRDEAVLVDMLIDNKVVFEKSTEDAYFKLVTKDNIEYSISGKELIDEQNRRDEEDELPRDGREL